MKPTHQTFLLEMLSHGDKLRAYQAAYPHASGEAMRTAANRLLRHPLIVEKLAAVQAAAQQQLQQHIDRAAEKETATLVSLHEKRQILSRMIRGQWKQVKHIKLKDAIHEVEVAITPAALLRAIELDTKLASGKDKEATPPAKPEIKTAAPPPVAPQPTIASPIEKLPALPPAPQPPPSKRTHNFDYIPKHITMIFPEDEPALIPADKEQTAALQTPPSPSEENWNLYLKLDANLRRTPAALLDIRKVNFEKLSLKQQQLILQPLIASHRLLKNHFQPLSHLSLPAQ